MSDWDDGDVDWSPYDGDDNNDSFDPDSRCFPDIDEDDDDDYDD